MIFEPITSSAIPRQCCICMRSADMTAFNLKDGVKDWKSKRYLCGGHAQILSQ